MNSAICISIEFSIHMSSKEKRPCRPEKRLITKGGEYDCLQDCTSEMPCEVMLFMHIHRNPLPFSSTREGIGPVLPTDDVAMGCLTADRCFSAASVYLERQQPERQMHRYYHVTVEPNKYLSKSNLVFIGLDRHVVVAMH